MQVYVMGEPSIMALPQISYQSDRDCGSVALKLADPATLSNLLRIDGSDLILETSDMA